MERWRQYTKQKNTHVILFCQERRWNMDNELVYSADATYQKAQYDASAKRLLDRAGEGDTT